ncbi:hypothetical protein ACJ41O_007368 [Fusarium nematophilum]
MQILNKIPHFARKSPEDDTHTQANPAVVDPETQVGTTHTVNEKEGGAVGHDGSNGSDTDENAPTHNAQIGVQKIEAVTLAWTKGSLAALLGLIWLMFLTNGFRISVLYTLQPYLTSEWQQHSLLTVINIVSDTLTAAVYIPMAKVLDAWGRAEGFLVMLGFSTLGLILMAAAQNLATFCAADVFYSIGFAGLIYCIVVLAADATNLKNRGLAFAFTSSPYMITAFAGSKAAEGFLLNVSWRWGFGAFAIITPFVTLPLYGVLKMNERKAQKQGIWKHEPSGRTLPQNIKHFVTEFDLLGVFLFGAGFCIFLLPFTLATTAPNGWKTGYIIAMIIVGFVVIILFALQQIYLSKTPFISRQFLLNRSVMGACLIDFTYQMSYASWNRMFLSFLQVVVNLTPAEAGYVNSTFQVVSGVLLFIVGYAIRRTGYFKWTFYPAIPLYIFALGLMIHFRQPNVHVGYIVMCEIFISIGGAVFILCMQLAVLAAVDHQHVASALAVLFVSGTIGSAVGSTISGTIWTNTFLPALMRNLPESALPNVATIYGDIVTQLSYPVGSVERIAIQKSYGYAQTRMLAAGTGLMALSVFWVMMIKNFNVGKMTQTKGTVL